MKYSWSYLRINVSVATSSFDIQYITCELFEQVFPCTGLSNISACSEVLNSFVCGAILH